MIPLLVCVFSLPCLVLCFVVAAGQVAQMSILTESNHMLRNKLRESEERSRQAVERWACPSECEGRTSGLRNVERGAAVACCVRRPRGW